MVKFNKPVFYLGHLKNVEVGQNVESSMHIAESEAEKSTLVPHGKFKPQLVTTSKLFYDVLTAINAEHPHRTIKFRRAFRIHSESDRHLIHLDITRVAIRENGELCAYLTVHEKGGWQAEQEILIRNPRISNTQKRDYAGERQIHTTKFARAMEVYRKYCSLETALEKKEANSSKLYEGLKKGNRSCENFEAEFEMYCLSHAEELMAMHEGLREKFDNRYQKYKVIKAMKPAMGTSFLSPVQSRHFQKPQSGYELIEHEGKYVITDFKGRRKKQYDELPPQFKTIVGSFKLMEDGTFIKGMGYVRERGHYWVLPEEWQEP